MSALQCAAGFACSISTPAEHFRRQTPQTPRRRHSISPRAFWPFTQTKKATSPAVIKEAKSKLAQLAGTKYGHNLSESQKQDVRNALKELEALDSSDIRQKALGGSNWKLLYTESTGSSGGKIGPLVGQVFPEDQPGIYINKLQLGPIRADLSANYDYSGANKINVSFIDIAAFLGPLQLIRKDFGGRSGFWKLTYHDEDLRILYTNQNNVFVLQRAE
ncbi:TPA: hypothetical protein ACH3X2_006059 [Trebouxia sp. C0005]